MAAGQRGLKRGLAEDLVQTALEKAYLRWDRIEMADPFAYVRQAVVNQHLSWVRRRPWRERPTGDAAELDLFLEPSGDPSSGVQHRVAIRSALAGHQGSLLAFLPGVAEIERTAEALARLPANVELHKLHGEALASRVSRFWCLR